MELLPLVCLWVLTRSGSTFAAEDGPAVIKMVVKEDSDAILPCSLSTVSIKDKVFDWKKDGQKEVFLYDKGSVYGNGHSGQDEQFRGRVSHFPENLDSGNASIVIRKTKAADSGNYTCDFPFHQPKRRSHIRLIVGAAQEPYVTILSETKDWALLQCRVRGVFPKPSVQWNDSARNVLPAEEPQVTTNGERFDVVLQTTVTKTDRFRCVATQEEIYHQIYSDIYVRLNETHTGLIVATAVLVTLLGVAVVIVVLLMRKKKAHVILTPRGGRPSDAGSPLKDSNG